MSSVAAPKSTTTRPGQVVLRAVRLVTRLVRATPWRFAAAVTAALLFTAAIVVSALVVGDATDEVIVPVLEQGEPAQGRLAPYLWLLLGVAVWKAVAIVLRRSAATSLQVTAQTELRRQLVRSLFRTSLRAYDRRGVGDLLSTADVDTRQATFVLGPLPFATGVLGLLLATIVVVAWTDLLLGAIALVLLVLVVVVDLRGAWRTFEGMEEVQRRRGRVAAVAHESFDGALTVTSLGRAAEETARFERAALHLRDQLETVGWIWTGYRAVTDALPGLGLVVLLVVGALEVSAGALTPGELVRTAYLVSLLSVPIRLIGYLFWDAAQSVAAWQRVAEVLDHDDRVQHGRLVPTPAQAPAGVRTEQVSFGYDPDRPVLTEVALTIAPGETVAVVGPTGSGKSTLALLLARLWDPDDGAITLDGIDLRELAPGVLPSEVAYVAQDTFLFDDSVLGNVALGAEVDAEAVREALRLANAEVFVEALPGGLDTPLGERGASLSGGQRQRLALARALVRRPRLLVLDDATSAVDPSVEARILRGLKRAAQPSTVVVVASRRASILLADRVVFVEDGRIRASGTHAELLAAVPGYARLLQAYEQDAERRLEERQRVEAASRDRPVTPAREGTATPGGSGLPSSDRALEDAANRDDPGQAASAGPGDVEGPTA
ncbi:MAG: ABC transporter ATP-binding protein [Nitriliruptoraceae bacterium]